MPIFNPTNYPIVTPVGADTVLLRQDASGEIKSARVSSLSAPSNGVQPVSTIAELRGISTRGIGTGWNALVSGYYSAEDGGGGNFYYDSTSTESDNGGTVIEPSSGVGRWIRLMEGDDINVLSFGAKRDFDITTWTGTDNTAAVQSAIDYAESQTNKVPNIIFPSGRFGLNSIRTNKCSIRGTRAGKTTNSQGTVLCHVSGATNHMIRLDDSGLTNAGNYEEVSDLMMLGSRERNLKNPKAITSVTSRTVFNVAPGDVPAASVVTTSFPFYGYCFFFSSENRYIGHGVVSAVNAGTGQITLATGWDNYATQSGAGNLLTTAEQVCFSPVATVSGPLNRADPSNAGYCAIEILTAFNKKLSRLQIQKFHAGVRLGTGFACDIDDVWTNNMSFAGVAQAYLAFGSDDEMKRVFCQGFYVADNGLPAESQTFIDTAYRKSATGVYGLRTRSVIHDLTVDEAVVGIANRAGYQIAIGTLLVDKPTKTAFICYGGQSTDSLLSVGTFFIATPNYTMPTNLTYVTGSRDAIDLVGTTARWLSIRDLSLIRFPGAGAPGDYTNLVRITDPVNTVGIGAISSPSGFTNIASSGTYPLLGDVAVNMTVASLKQWGTYKPDASTVAFAASGKDILNGTSAQTKLRSADTDTLVGNATGTKLYAAGTEAVNLIASDNKVALRGASGRQVFDLMALYMGFGSDESGNDSRTNLTNKAGRFTGVPYDLSQKEVALMEFSAQLAINIMRIGSADGTLQSPTILEAYLATAINSAGVRQMALDTSDSTTQTGLRLMYGGQAGLKRVEVGAADSGGAGYRLLRISN